VVLTPIDLKIPHPGSGTRLLSSAYAVAAVGLLVVGCSTPGVSAPTRSRPSPPTTPAPATTADRTQTVASTSSVTASFTLPGAVSRPTVFAEGEGLLVVGGLTAADTTTQAILRVALPGGAVTPAGRLPVGVHDAAGAVVNDRDLVFGGGSTAVTSAVQDVTPGSAPRLISHLPQPRADLVAVSDGRAGYVLGGFDGTQGSTTILRTRDGRTFSVAGTLPVSVRYPAVAVSAGAIWLFGGEHDGKQIADVQRIDLATGRGRVVGHLPNPLAHAGAFTLGGAVFVAGGRVGGRPTDKVMRFDPANVRFTAAGHLPAGRSDFGVAVVGGTAYLVGGESPESVDTVIQVRAQAGGTP
jgi:Kelch motif